MINKMRVLLLTGLVLFLAGNAAWADNIIGTTGNLNDGSAWTVYAFSNAQAMADAFRSINNFTASGTFQSLVGLIAVLGSLAVGVGGGFSPAIAKTFIGYTTGVFLITYIFFGVGNGGPLQVQIEVYDTVDGTWVAPVNVPAVVGIPASIISVAGHEITKQIEASFPIPDEMKLSGGAPFNLASSLIADASQARISDPALANSMAYYVQDCFTIAATRGDISAAVLTTSTDFINDIKTDYVSVYVNTTLDNSGKASTADVVSCADAWTRINTAINASGTGASSFLSSASAWAKTPALSIVNSAADAVASWATQGGITDGGALVKQSAVLATFSGAFRQTAAATGNSDFLTGLNVAQAQSMQKTGWITGAEVFNRSMGYIYAILQVFVYGVMPLVLAAALIPGLGMALLKNFGQILIWLAIWQPMLAIVNFIVLSMQQADLGGALASGAGTYGFNLINMGVITEKTSNMRAAALFIGTMVPGLAWAMVKGSVDFSKFIAEGTGEKFAHSAANSMATGNYSINSGSMDTFSANKNSYGATFDAGNGMTGGAGAGAINQKYDWGGHVAQTGSQSADVKVSNNAGTSDGGSLVHNVNQGATAGRQVMGGTGNAFSSGGGTGTVGSNMGTLGDNTNISGNIMQNLRFPGGGGAGGAGPGSGTMAPNSPLNQMLQTPGTEAPQLAAKRGPGLQGPQAAGQLSQAVQKGNTVTGGNNAQASTNGQRTLTGNESTQYGTNAMRGDGASRQEGYQNSNNTAVTGISSLRSRLEALNAARGDRSSYLNWNNTTPGRPEVQSYNGPAHAETVHGDTSTVATSGISGTITALQNGTTATDMASRLNEVREAFDKTNKEIASEKKAAEKAAAEAKAKSDKAASAGAGGAAAMSKEAHGSLLEHTGEVLKRDGKEIMETAGQVADWTEKKGHEVAEWTEQKAHDAADTLKAQAAKIKK